MGFREKMSLEIYNVGIVKKPIGKILRSGIAAGEITWMRHPYRDRFFADPFLWYQDDSFYYILAEEYIFWERKGKISCLKVQKSDFSLADKEVVIEEPVHLSFPFCEEGGDTVIPESVRMEGLYAYRLDMETHKIKSREKLSDIPMIDTVRFKCSTGDWFFTCTRENPYTDLYLYRYEDGVMKEPLPNPVKKSIRASRSAGRIFRYGKEFYRPTQVSEGKYGHETALNRILQLNDAGYDTLETAVLSSRCNPPFNQALHTFNGYKDFSIVDGEYDALRPASKIIYRIRRIFHETPATRAGRR